MASGDVFSVITPQSNEPPSSNFATVDVRNGHVVLDFDASTDEEAVFKFFLPSYYSSGGLTVDIFFAMTSATSGNVVWQAAIERVTDSNQDIDIDSFASFNSSGAVSVPSTSGFVKKATITFSNGAEMDSLAAGEWGRLKIRRDADNTSDTATGDAELWSVTIRET